MAKTVINIKLDKDLKEEAQRLAKELGLPITTVVSNYLREFVKERRVVFSDHPTPNAKTRKELDAALKDVRHGRNLSPTFKGVGDAIRYLNS